MALTQDQIQQVIQALSNTALDPIIKLEVETLLGLGLHGGAGGASTVPYATIKGFCKTYDNVLEVAGHGVVQANYLNEMMLVYMDKAAVTTVMNNTPTNGFVAGIMGVYQNASGNQQLTISLLPVDSSFKFVKDTAGNYLAGEQCWKTINTLANFDSVFG